MTIVFIAMWNYKHRNDFCIYQRVFKQTRSQRRLPRSTWPPDAISLAPVNYATSLQMARISLIDEKLDEHNNGRNIILLDVYFGKLINFKILIMFQFSCSWKKNVEIRRVQLLCYKSFKINWWGQWAILRSVFTPVWQPLSNGSL